MGLIKTLLVLRHALAPPNLNFSTLRPDARINPTIISIPSSQTGPVKLTKLVGGVNSFGAGGTNAHAVLEAWNGPESERVVFGEFVYPNFKYVRRGSGLNYRGLTI